MANAIQQSLANQNMRLTRAINDQLNKLSYKDYVETLDKSFNGIGDQLDANIKELEAFRDKT